jgi:hypothetical protein
MKAALTQTVCVAALTFALTAVFAPADAQQTNLPKFSVEELARRTVERRAVDAVIWGMPIVSFDALRQGYFRDGKVTEEKSINDRLICTERTINFVHAYGLFLGVPSCKRWSLTKIR